MDKRSVSSRGIRWVRYDDAKQTLDVQYASTKTYRYFGVPRAVYEWLLRADSKGKFVTRLVKEKYAYERLGDAAEEADLTRLLTESLRSPPPEEE